MPQETALEDVQTSLIETKQALSEGGYSDKGCDDHDAIQPEKESEKLILKVDEEEHGLCCQCNKLNA